MDIVEFLEARLTEQESALRDGSFILGVGADPAPDDEGDSTSLRERMVEECGQQRSIIASWREAAEAEGITDPGQATETVTIARRAMLTILASSHRDHPDYDPDWAPELTAHPPGGPPSTDERDPQTPRP